MAEDPGYDYLIQAQAGLMSITGVPDGQPGAGPQRVGLATADLTTGMNAAIAILAALQHRHQSGEGQYVDMALLDVQVSWLANQAQNYFCSGRTPVRTGEYHPNLAPYQPFSTRDGQLIIAVGNDSQFQRLCEALEVPHLSHDPRFSTNPARVNNREELVETMTRAIRRKTSSEWTSILRRIKIPCGPIQSIDEVFSDPQVMAREMIVEIEHPEFGSVKTVANPIRYSQTPLVYHKAPPQLGEDTETVLANMLGFDEARIADLKFRGVV